MEDLNNSAQDVPQAVPSETMDGPDDGPVISAESMMGSRQVELIFPFKVDGKMLRRVQVRIPSQGDIDDFISGELPTLRHLLARLTNLHLLVIRALNWEDSKAVHQIFKDVLPLFIQERLDA